MLHRDRRRVGHRSDLGLRPIRMKGKALIENRPAETGGFASGVAVLICYIAGVNDPGVLAALAVVVGALPGVITTIVVRIRSA